MSARELNLIESVLIRPLQRGWKTVAELEVGSPGFRVRSGLMSFGKWVHTDQKGTVQDLALVPPAANSIRRGLAMFGV